MKMCDRNQRKVLSTIQVPSWEKWSRAKKQKHFRVSSFRVLPVLPTYLYSVTACTISLPQPVLYPETLFRWEQQAMIRCAFHQISVIVKLKYGCMFIHSMLYGEHYNYSGGKERLTPIVLYVWKRNHFDAALYFLLFHTE